MRAALTVALVSTLSGTQQAEPLRKSDLVRLLTGSAVNKQEVAGLVRSNCLAFVPTARDRADLRSLGADSAIMARVDECAARLLAALATPVSRPARRDTVRAPAPGAPGRDTARREPRARPGAPVPPTLAAPAAPAASAPAPTAAARTPPSPVVLRARIPAPAGTGYVTGTGQRGLVGTTMPVPLVFEARDAANAPLAGQAVTFDAVNARIDPPVGVTDSAGQVRLRVTLGPRAGAATVTARIGSLERQAAMIALAGPPARLVLRCREAPLARRLVVAAGQGVTLRITVEDALGNALDVTAFQLAAADERVVRVSRVAVDRRAGTAALVPERAGTTSLALMASGLREHVSVTVLARGVAGPVDCP